MWRVIKQRFTGNSKIWVAKLDTDDALLEYETFSEATNKAQELETTDETGRRYSTKEK